MENRGSRIEREVDHKLSQLSRLVEEDWKTESRCEIGKAEDKKKERNREKRRIPAL